MTFDELLAQALECVQREGRMSTAPSSAASA